MRFLFSVFIFTVINFSTTFLEAGDKRFAILIPSYNNEAYVEWNLLSALNQNYENYYIVYINDASTDRTLEIAKDIVSSEGKEDIVAFIDNFDQQGALENQYETIHRFFDDDDIIVFLDGDDALAHPNVLNRLNQIYNMPDKEVWVTYGQFSQRVSGECGYCYPYPQKVIDEHEFRAYVHGPSHLRTAYTWLFKRIKKDDLLYDDLFIPMSTNVAIMIPMIEMAANGHFQFIPEILYIYNDNNPLSHHNTNAQLQTEMNQYIRAKEPYDPL